MEHVDHLARVSLNEMIRRDVEAEEDLIASIERACWRRRMELITEE